VTALATSATADNFVFMFSFPFLLLNRLPVHLTQAARNEKRFFGDPLGIIGSEEHRHRSDTDGSHRLTRVLRRVRQNRRR
jgi:hypothetical protein